MAEDTLSKEKISDRDFLKLAGVGLAAATLVASGVVARERLIFLKNM